MPNPNIFHRRNEAARHLSALVASSLLSLVAVARKKGVWGNAPRTIFD